MKRPAAPHPTSRPTLPQLFFLARFPQASMRKCSAIRTGVIVLRPSPLGTAWPCVAASEPPWCRERDPLTLQSLPPRLPEPLPVSLGSPLPWQLSIGASRWPLEP